MDFEAYYDSSGQRLQQPATTLAGIAACKDVWEQFNATWRKVLDERGVPDRLFSMADLMSGYGRFGSWDDARKDQLLTALINVLAKFKPFGMSAYSCTVFFDAYDMAKAKVPKLLELEAICVNHSVGGLQLATERPDGELINLKLFFDRNEPFLNMVTRIWLQSKKKKKGWPHQVRNICPAADSYYGIQAADLVAWIVNRHRCEAFARGDPQPTARLSLSDHLDRQAYLFFSAWMMISPDMRVYADAAEIVEYWKSLESMRDAN